ncbi:MAG: hypothetical protein QM726_10685 [Chitinophagaceae bacterium]
MKLCYGLLFLPIVFSCSKSSDSSYKGLQSKETTDYTGNIVRFSYSYDAQGRITSITQQKNNGQPTLSLTVNYQGNEAVLLSFPDTDPAYVQKKQVRYTLDATGLPLQRIEFTQLTAKLVPVNPSQEFRNDTIMYEYDASGMLAKTTRSRRDSVWVETNYTIIRQFSSRATYSNSNGNLQLYDEYVTYPIVTMQGGMTTVSGGSSAYHQVYQYTKAFPNKTDFNNAFVLNEIKASYEPLLNSHYKNMPDKVISDNTDKDMNGVTIFKGIDTINMDRLYNENGLLSSVRIPPGHTQDTLVRYFYHN